MDSIVSVSPSQLARRRRQLRRARRVKLLQRTWQFLGAIVLAGGLVALARSPIWVIGSAEQVTVEGNELLSDRAIRSLLSLSYPQSLFQVRPDTLVAQLESSGPIAYASVTRQLFPPGLTVDVRERAPVAIASIPAQTPTPSGSNAPSVPATSRQLVLLDEEGMWMPVESYTSLDRGLKIPDLKIVGELYQFRPYWRPVYRAIADCAVKIYELDWQDPKNLILKTELGNVRLGPYNSRFSERLELLERMRKLPEAVNPAQIDYIDLTNPQSPALKMKQPPSSPASGDRS
ncbi:cell division protein FtsQ/DivIB [Oxynema aestuarii]|jgi:cell division protein FtsQ|uniref:FtsQ-type POTRA domain-containing protein n=1 Tax=Oxynema aestuarii AP17 TaxID=2064643 RepID=A0A6H1TXP1_9CYAN|nr:FtsQ-type POTRA domain-containing protein [Oxynema aestuarii]QIZ70976.1 FtsQ-type POTRA domain-containing protein [Oxynema aestuarii AP17]RMH71850.1 MAG: FtsQ-type POTRA domain-containing protein [Cyanobacteria bacterium J007]